MTTTKTRVHELAKEIEKTSKEVLEACKKLGISANSAMNVLTDKEVENLKKELVPPPPKRKLTAVFRPQNSAQGGRPSRPGVQPRPVAPGGRPAAPAQGTPSPAVSSHPAARAEEAAPKGAVQENKASEEKTTRPAAPERTVRVEKPGNAEGTRAPEDRPAADSQKPQGERPLREGGRMPADRPARDGSRAQTERPAREGGRAQTDRPVREGGRYQTDRPVRDGNRFQGDRPSGGRYQTDRPPVRDGQRRPGDRPAGRDGGRPGFGRDGGGQGRMQGGVRNDARGPAARGGRPGGESLPMGKPSTKQTQKPKTNSRQDRKRNEKQEAEEMFLKKGQRPGNRPAKAAQAEEEIKTIILPDTLTIKELADKMKIQPSTIVKKLFLAGKVVTINQEIDFEMAEEIAMEYEILCEHEEKIDVLGELLKDVEDEEATLKKRPPVVCVMGHVDHGKPSLLGAIRRPVASPSISARMSSSATGSRSPS